MHAVEVLHSVGIIHADMKNEIIHVNMLRDGSQLDLTLLDLGCSTKEGMSKCQCLAPFA